MKVTFIAPPAGMSGGFRVMVIYAKKMIERGHSVKFVLPPPPPPTLWTNIKRLLRGKGWTKYVRCPPSHLDGSGVPFILLDRFRPVTDEDVPDADVVIATWWETAEWVSGLSPNKGAKAYFIQHHEVFAHLPVERVKATYRLPFHKIVVSKWLKDVMAETYDDPIADVVPNSVDRSQFFAPPRNKSGVPTIGFVYATTPINDFKGLDVALAAIELIRRKHPDVQVVAFGSIQPSAAMPLPPKAKFFYCPQQDALRQIYASCDVWIVPSRSEGFGLPTLEAMACRTPVVATRTGWAEESIQSGFNGVLVPVDDPIAIAEGVSWILQRIDREWQALSENAYLTASRGSWDDYAVLFEAALEHARTRSQRGEISGVSGG